MGTDSEAPPPRRLLVWDAPNLDVALGTLLGGRPPKPQERPRFDVLARWLVERSAPGEIPEACVFVNILPERVDAVRPWIDVLRSSGFAVFAKPKLADDVDIDGDIIEHVARRAQEGPLAEVLVASADQFRDDPGGGVAALADRLPVTILGFREFARAADGAAFIDLEDIPGLFQVALERETPLDRLPPEGAWLAPRQGLLELYGAP